MGKLWTNIGTSGWHHPYWIGNFYPEDIARRDMLSYFNSHLTGNVIWKG